MKRGDEGESHNLKVGNGRKSGMDKITIMKKEKGVEGGEDALGCLHGWASANVLVLIRDRTFNLIQLGASTAFLLGQFEPSCIISIKNSLSRNHSSSTPRPFG
jgi:hypothetical protein